MYLNPGVIAGLMPLYPSGTNSTMFTECCECAICDDEPFCPSCGRKVMEYRAKPEKPRIGVIEANCHPPGPLAIELTPEVRQALEDAGLI